MELAFATILISVPILILILILFYIISTFNLLIALKNNIKSAWANIDVILKQRYDETPNLVKICKQYAKHEKELLASIVHARKKMENTSSKFEQLQGNEILTKGVQSLYLIGEDYPELKSDKLFITLQDRLSELEETLADRREYYNNTVNIYNTRIGQFPEIFFAMALRLKEQDLYKVHLNE